jgi:hypothetical protein
MFSSAGSLQGMLLTHSISSRSARYVNWWTCVSSSRHCSTLACTP